MELAVQKEALGYPNCPPWSPRAARSCSQNPQDQPGELAAGGEQGTVYLAASPPLALVKTDLLKAFSPKHTLPGSQQVGERQQQTAPHRRLGRGEGLRRGGPLCLELSPREVTVTHFHARIRIYREGWLSP